MIVIFCLAIGAIFGGLRARKSGGSRLDMLQYAAVFCIIGAIVGLFVTIGLEKLL
jgi:uncharacterized protein YqgC (DUF456 family)